MVRRDRRRLERTSLGLALRIERGDGSTVAGTCVDASDEAFAITTEVPLGVGEFVRLKIGRRQRSFVAQVVWQKDERFGLRCLPAA
jgi:PilZ domain